LSGSSLNIEFRVKWMLTAKVSFSVTKSKTRRNQLKSEIAKCCRSRKATHETTANECVRFLFERKVRYWLID
jgi:hypothetical protein